MKKRIVLFIMIALVVFSGAMGCTKKKGSSGKAEFSGNYNFGGSTTVEPIALTVISDFKKLYPDAHISYDSIGSSAGVKGVLAGTYSLGGASRDLKGSESAKGAKATAVAKDGVAVIVNKESVLIDNLSFEQVGKIYSGEITNWKEVGGPDAEIAVFNRDEASGTRDCFKMTVDAIEAGFRDDAAVVTSNGDMVAKVGGTPNAIGYCGFGYLDRDPGIKSVTIDSVTPEIDNVLDHSYKISRNLNLVYTELKKGSLEEAFINYCLSDEGQAIAVEEGFIKLRKEARAESKAEVKEQN